MDIVCVPYEIENANDRMKTSSLTFWAAAPKGPLTYAFTQGEISPSPPPSPVYPPPRGPNPSFEAHIPALRLQSQPQGLNPSPEAQIAAWRLKSQP